MKLVRIWFKKQGTARYISHLDLNRCVMRAFQMAKIPLWHTQGFHPHPFITFALPLPLGVSGDRESLDIKLEEEISNDHLLSRLNHCLPAGIEVTGVTEPVMKPGAIAAASYRITLDADGKSPAEMAENISRLFSQTDIIVPKRSKSGVHDVNLKKWLQNTTLQEGEDCVQIRALLPAGSVENVSPNLLLTAIKMYLYPEAFAKTERLCMFDGEGKEFA